MDQPNTDVIQGTLDMLILKTLEACLNLASTLLTIRN